jgi:two-component system, cell cycle sensor histidine kinase and response regulator CckA
MGTTDQIIPPAFRLLIAGQGKDFADFFQGLSATRGWQIDQASTGRDALERMRQQPPDLLAIDLGLPDLAAVDLAGQARQNLGFSLPWIVLASPGREREALDMLKLGAFDCLFASGASNTAWLFALERTLALFEKERRLGTEMKSWRRREEVMRANEDILQLVVRNISEIITRHTPRGHFLYATQSIEKLLGYKPEELSGKTLASLIYPEEVAGVWRRVRQALRERQSECRLSFRMQHKSGRQVWVDTHARLVISGRKLREIQCTIRDVTEQKRAEEERHKLETRVQQARKMESLSVLASGIAHDFNNLLAAILSNAELASLELSPVSPVRDNLYRVIQAAHRATQLVGQMQVYSGQGRYLVQMLDLAEIAREFSQPPAVILPPIITLEMEFGTGVPPIQGDPIQIRQVLTNLVANAAEAIGDQIGTIRIATGVMDCDRVCLQGCFCDENLPEGRYAFLEVADNGCGMTAEVQIKMFEPFFTTKFAGRGLGLAAVLGIMRAHAGAIKVASAPGQGSIFRVLFPSAVSRITDCPPVAPSAKTWRGSGTVMVVDDEEDARSAIRKHLARLGFLVTTAVDGPHALDIFRKAPNEFVCVLVDDAMPHMNGQDTFHALRRIRHDIKVILAAEGTRLENVRQFARREKIGFIEKPCCLETLQQILQQTIEQSGEP